MSLPTVIRPSRAASLRRPSWIRVLQVAEQDVDWLGAMSGTFATIFSFEKSRKWIIREGEERDLADGLGRVDRKRLEEVSGVSHGADFSCQARVRPSGHCGP